MHYKSDYNHLKEHFTLNSDRVDFPGYDFSIYNLPFESKQSEFLPSGKGVKYIDSETYHLFPDNQIKENKHFSYPILTDDKSRQSSEVIILLHGLNERDWDKYLPWAKALHERTGQPVILFPISFHVNRCPSSWKDPRLMSKLAKDRKRRYPDLSNASFVNAAISERIDEMPRRFYTSGLETYYDIVAMVRQLKTGKHPLLSGITRVNFFGYSIGALLTEVLLMTNPDNLLKDSKAVLFCGGTTLDRMKGASRFIIDNAAFNTLKSYFFNLDKQLKKDRDLKMLLTELKPGISFKAMIDSMKLIRFRNKRLKALQSRLLVLSMLKDRVIPPASVIKTFSGFSKKISGLIRVFDFPYSYTHENIFPVNNNRDEKVVNKAFDKIFNQACLHLF
jgi:pimeloyl-ACP methyl ester carboxylesterase